MSADAGSEHVTLQFQSIAELRNAHRALLEKQQDVADAAPMRGEMEAFVRAACASGIRLHARSDRDLAQAVIDYWSSELYRVRVEVTNTNLLPFDENAEPELDPEACPYAGMQPFPAEMSDVFFGRDAMIEEVLTRLRSEPLVIVLGQSGTGKSSLVSGGVIPRLRRDAIGGSANWRYLERVVPGTEPLISLARLLVPADATRERLEQEAKRLRDNPSHLRTALTSADEPYPVLLFVDQFEELFTLCSDIDERRRFAESLIRLAESPDAGHHVILTMRSDIVESNLVQLDQLVPYIERGKIRIGAFRRSELREIIEKPAEKVGLKFDSGLVDKLIDDTIRDPASLPLLQFALRVLWDRKRRNRLTLEAYEDIDGALNALGKIADLVLGRMPERREMVKTIFLRIVRPSRDGRDPTSRRILTRDAVAGLDDSALEVVDTLVQSRLLRRSGRSFETDEQIEIAHEALITHWTTLGNWLAQRRAAMQDRDLLTDAAMQWHARYRKIGLLDKAATAEARHWIDTAEAKEVGVSELVVQYVKASERAVGRQKAIRRWLVGGLIAAALSASAGFALYEWQSRLTLEAERNFDVAVEQKRTTAEKLERLKAKRDDEVRNDRIRELESNLRKAALEAQMNVATANGEIQTRDEQIKQLQTKLTEAENGRTAAENGRTAVTTVANNRAAEIERLQKKLEEQKPAPQTATAPPPPAPEPVYELPGKDDRLSIMDAISTTVPNAPPARIVCFARTKNNHFIIAPAAVLKGLPGDLVIRRGKPTPQRIGVIWSIGNGAVSIRLLSGVSKDADTNMPDFGRVDRPAYAVDKKDKVSVIGSSKTVEGVVESVTKEQILVDASVSEVQIGAPVGMGKNRLVGFVIGRENSGKLIVTPIEPILKTLGLDIEETP